MDTFLNFDGHVGEINLNFQDSGDNMAKLSSRIKQEIDASQVEANIEPFEGYPRLSSMNGFVAVMRPVAGNKTIVEIKHMFSSQKLAWTKQILGRECTDFQLIKASSSGFMFVIKCSSMIGPHIYVGTDDFRGANYNHMIHLLSFDQL